MSIHHRIPLLLLGLLFATATPAATPNWHDINLTIVHEHVLPRYQALAAATARLEQQGQAFCSSVDADGLAKLRQSYNEAMDAWMGVQHIRLGPVEMLMRYHRYQLWPDKHNTGAKHMRDLLAEQDLQRLQPDNFQHISVAVQGFTALEGMLYGKGDTLKGFGTQGQAGYRCHVVEAIGHNLATMSAELEETWGNDNTPFQKMFNYYEPTNGVDDPDSSREVAARFLNQLHTQLEAVVDQKLGRPLDASPAKAKPTRAESWRSRRSMRNIVLNLEATEALYLTGYSPAVKAKPEGVEVDKRIRAGFRDAIVQAKGFKRPLYEIARDPAQRPQLQRLQQTITGLKGEISANLSQILDLPQAFNSLDGD